MKNPIRIIGITLSSILLVTFIAAPGASGWNDNDISVSLFGGSTNEEARWMAVDGVGNTFSSGYFTGTVDFDPGRGVTNMTSVGGLDIFITKLDPSGNLLWAKRIGGSGGDEVTSISVDSSGSVITTGSFEGTVDFDPGDGIANLTSAGGGDIFVSKLDSSGNYLWAKSMKGLDFQKGIFVAVDRDGNVGVTGLFSDTVDFDPSDSIESVTSRGDWDAFISKFNSAGNYLWTKRIGGSGRDGGGGIAFDGSGNIYASGGFSGTVDFDPGESLANLTSAGDVDMYISKFDSAGNYLWAKRIGGSGGDGSAPIVLDSLGSIYMTGIFPGTVDFDPGDGVANLISKGDIDSFVLKLDSSGNYIWAKSFGSSGSDAASSICVDRSGSVVTTGSFPGTVDFDPGSGVANLTSSGGTDSFVLKLDSSGNYLWAKRVGGTSSERGLSIGVDSTGNVYSTGYFQLTTDFDPSDGIANLTSVGDFDIYILKLNSEGLVIPISVPTAPLLNALVASRTQISLSFTAGADGGAAISDLKYSLNGGQYVSARTTSSPFIISSLASNTTYSVKIRAANYKGDGAESTSLSTTTLLSQSEAAAVEAAAKVAAEAAAVKREAEKKSARADIATSVKSAKELTVESFTKAEIPGINALNIDAVKAELSALPEESKNDFNQILKVARKYEVVGSIASDQVTNILPNVFVEIGLIPQASKNKVALVSAVKKLPAASRDSYIEIKAAIEAETKKIQVRQERLAAIISRNTTRSNR